MYASNRSVKNDSCSIGTCAKNNPLKKRYLRLPPTRQNFAQSFFYSRASGRGRSGKSSGSHPAGLILIIGSLSARWARWAGCWTHSILRESGPCACSLIKLGQSCLVPYCALTLVPLFEADPVEAFQPRIWYWSWIPTPIRHECQTDRLKSQVWLSAKDPVKKQPHKNLIMNEQWRRFLNLSLWDVKINPSTNYLFHKTEHPFFFCYFKVIFTLILLGICILVSHGNLSMAVFLFSSIEVNQIENSCKLRKERSRRYSDDIALLAYTPAQAETLLHSLERTAAGIGLHVNADKTEYMCFNQRSDISTLKSGPLKLVDKFTYQEM